MAKITRLELAHDKNRIYYVPSDLNYTTEKELRKEYTRLRDIARKRIDRLEKAGLATKQEIQEYREMFPKISDITTAKLAHYAKVANIENSRNLVSDYQKKARKALQEFAETGNVSIKSELQNALSDVSRLLNKKPTTIPEAKKYVQYKLDQFEKAVEKIPAVREMGSSAWWEFVKYTRRVLNENVYYWEERKPYYYKMLSNSGVISSINNFNFGKAWDQIKKGEDDEDIEDTEDYNSEFEEFWNNY